MSKSKNYKIECSLISRCLKNVYFELFCPFYADIRKFKEGQNHRQD